MRIRRTWQGTAVLTTTLALAVAGLALTPMPAATAQATAKAAATGTVAGTVVDADGKPVDLAFVSVRTAGQLDDDSVPYETLTDPDGSYRLEAPAGTWIVTVDPTYAPGMLRRDVQVAADATTTVDLAVPRSVEVTGSYTVADSWPSTGPQPSAVLRLTALDADAFPRTSEPETKDGGELVTHVAAGRYRARLAGYLYYDQCYGAGMAPTSDPTCASTGSVVTVGTSDRRLDPVALGFRWTKISGTVRGPDGKPLRGVHVQDDSDDDDTVDVTGSDGRYGFFSESTVRTTFMPRAADDARGVRSTVATIAFARRGNQTIRYDARLRSTSRTKASATGGRRKATVTVRVTPRFTGATRDGRVSVRYKKTDGRAGVRTGTLSRSGRVTVRLPKVRKGVRTLTVSYGGGSGMLPSRAKVRVRVR